MRSENQTLSQKEIADLGAQTLIELWRLTIEALVDAAGSDEAIDIMKPFMKAHAAAGTPIAMNVWKSIGYQNCTEEELFVRAKDWSDIIFGRTKRKLEITDSGFKGGEILSCPFEKANPTICTILCDQFNNLALKEINPNWRLILTHSLAQGDAFCQWIGKGFNDFIGDKIKTILLQPFRVPQEILDYWRVAWVSELWVIATNAVVSFAGHDGAIKMIEPYIKQNGMSIALSLSKRMGIDENNATGIAAIIDISNNALQQKGKIITNTTQRVEKEISECPFSGGTGEICADLLTISSNGICEAINPDYEFLLTKRMCKGDKTCQWVIKKKMLNSD
ncbi:MAG: L-2-amino-thiazoline-4-carboxylic acid hydrolase [Candidatus Methanoperedens sp.]|nr:L-2-amino-thiazoline-4-carboxylic acid hydrolase [Candidatus Methanoperedens sp.]